MTDESTLFTVPLTAYLAAVISHDLARESTLLDRVQIQVDNERMTNVIKVDSIGGTYDVTVTRITE